MKKLLPLLLICLAFAGRTMAQSADADKILGTFYLESPLSDDNAKVTFKKSAKGTYFAKIIWIDKPYNADGTLRTDEKNPDPKLRSRHATDVVLVWGLTYKDGEWVEGSVYDPFSGKSFGVKMKLEKNGKDLSVRYYKGKPALGITRTWTRVEK